MRNHIVFKFLALTLCAACLLGAVGAGLGLLAFHELGLSQRTPEEARTAYTAEMAGYLADSLARRYASGSLGGVPSDLLNAYYPDPYLTGTWDFSRVGVTILDENGERIHEMPQDTYPIRETYTTWVEDGEYLRVVRTMTMDEYEAMENPVAEVSPLPPDPVVYDALPQDGAEVWGMEVHYADGGVESHMGSESLGTLIRGENGAVVFYGAPGFSGPEVGLNGEVVYLCFLDRAEELLYEISGSPGNGVLARYSGSENYFMELRGGVLQEETARPGQRVWRIEYRLAGGETVYLDRGTVLGFLVTDRESSPVFTSVEGISSLEAGALRPESIAFYDLEGNVLLASSPDQGGYLISDGQGGLTWFLPEPEAVPSGADQAPEEPVPVIRATLTYADGYSESVGGAPDIGSFCLENGHAVFRTDPGLLELRDAVLTEISLYDAQEQLVYDARDPEGVGSLTLEEETLVFREAAEPEAAAASRAAAPESLPEESLPQERLCYHPYYDSETGMQRMAEYVHEPMPAYTVEITLAENALLHGWEWELMTLVHPYRQQLPMVLAASILGFALTLVYLCCAAARRPGSTELRPGGLNRLPLDGWFCLVCLGLAVLAVMGVEGTAYLIDGDLSLGLLYALLCGYTAALLLVSFLFACAAQFKSDGYWWRGSLFGLSMKLVVVLWDMTCRVFGWLWEHLRLHGVPGLKTLALWLWELAKALAGWAGKWLRRGLDALHRLCRRGRKAGLAFFSLLPVTWQWLLVGSTMIFALFVTIAGRYDLGIVLAILFSIALVVYGAHAFGVLLDSARRMSRGRLDEKVDDKLLIGAFKDFAGELNSLADVAVVAARNQLRSERMKTELITNVSHDIKTPLTSIINYVDLLKTAKTQEERQTYLEVLSRQSQSLKKLIEDLMELSKASTGNLTVDIRSMDAGETVNQALGEFADKLEKAQLTPVFRQPGEPVRMLADGRLAWRVLSNLLGNAVKYALPGTRLYVDLVRAEGKVIVSLKNISRESLNVSADELLERFVRGDASRNTEGSGLGLNIAQSLMEVQKGSLQLLVDGDLFKVTLIFPEDMES